MHLRQIFKSLVFKFRIFQSLPPLWPYDSWYVDIIFTTGVLRFDFFLCMTDARISLWQNHDCNCRLSWHNFRSDCHPSQSFLELNCWRRILRYANLMCMFSREGTWLIWVAFISPSLQLFSLHFATQSCVDTQDRPQKEYSFIKTFYVTITRLCTFLKWNGISLSIHFPNELVKFFRALSSFST